MCLSKLTKKLKNKKSLVSCDSQKCLFSPAVASPSPLLHPHKSYSLSLSFSSHCFTSLLPVSSLGSSSLLYYPFDLTGQTGKVSHFLIGSYRVWVEGHDRIGLIAGSRFFLSNQSGRCGSDNLGFKPTKR